MIRALVAEEIELLPHRLRPEPAERPRQLWPWLLSGLGLAGVGLALAALFTAVSALEFPPGRSERVLRAGPWLRSGVYTLAAVWGIFSLAGLPPLREVIARHLETGGRMHQITRHMLGLFHGRPGARMWKRILSERGSAGTLDDYDAALTAVGARELA